MEGRERYITGIWRWKCHVKAEAPLGTMRMKRSCFIMLLTLNPHIFPVSPKNWKIYSREHGLLLQRTGNPNHEGMPKWEPVKAKEEKVATMVFDRECVKCAMGMIQSL